MHLSRFAGGKKGKQTSMLIITFAGALFLALHFEINVVILSSYFKGSLRSLFFTSFIPGHALDKT